MDQAAESKGDSKEVASSFGDFIIELVPFNLACTKIGRADNVVDSEAIIKG